MQLDVGTALVLLMPTVTEAAWPNIGQLQRLPLDWKDGFVVMVAAVAPLSGSVTWPWETSLDALPTVSSLHPPNDSVNHLIIISLHWLQKSQKSH